MSLCYIPVCPYVRPSCYNPPMYLSRLSLAHFRNCAGLKLDLPPGLIAVLGGNGQGKSNLLEAAYLLSIAKSYRSNVERELVSWEAQKAVEQQGDAAALEYQTLVTGDVEQSAGRLRIIIGLRLMRSEGDSPWQVQKEIRVNGAVTSASGLVGQMNAVLFTAADVDLVLGPPSGRRRFLDILISQVDPLYLRSLQRAIRNADSAGDLPSVIIDLCQPGDLNEANYFAGLITEVWNNTFRYELRGRTPNEVRGS